MGSTGSFLRGGGGVGDVARHTRYISKIAGICCDTSLTFSLLISEGFWVFLSFLSDRNVSYNLRQTC